MTTEFIPSPATDSADPTIRFTVTFEFQFRYSVPLWISGIVRTAAGKAVGDLVRIPVAENAWHDGLLARGTQNENPQKRKVVMDCRLTARALQAILEERDAEPKKNVVLKVDLAIEYFYPRFGMSNVGAPSTPNVVTGDQTTWGPGLGEFKTVPDSGTITIYSSQWASDFAPAFGIGRFLILEVPDVNHTRGSGPLEERVQEAAASLERMRTDIAKGDWTQCAVDARPVVELLNKKDLLRPLLETNGIQPATADALLAGLTGVLEYAHAFHHRVSKDLKTVVPAVNAESEDAFLAFATSAALLNLIARKLRKVEQTT